eukprot:scaffold76534_cov29-Attheya_sp.AAC.1
MGSSSANGGADPLLLQSSKNVDYRTCLARTAANRRTALELASVVRVMAHELSLEEFAAVENFCFSAVFALMHSKSLQNKLAGVAALDALLGEGVPSADEEKKAIQFANNLSNGLRAASAMGDDTDYEFLAALAGALGRMAMGASNVDYVETE